MKSFFLPLYITSIALLFAPCCFGETDWQRTLAEGEHELAVGNTNHALTIFLQKVNKYPSSAACHTALGRAYKRLGKIDEAKAEFKQATQLEPDFPDAFYELGVVEEYDSHWLEAASAFEKFLVLKPSAANRLALPDRIRFCKEHLPSAQNSLTGQSSKEHTTKIASAPIPAVTSSEAKHTQPAQANQASTYFDVDQNGITDTSSNLSSKVDLATPPAQGKSNDSDSNPDLLIATGMNYAQSGQYDQAIEVLSKAIALKSDNARAYNDRSVVYIRLKQYADAIKDCSKAIALQPDYALAYRNRAIAYGNAGEHAKEIEDYSQAIKLKPSESSYYRGRGTAFAKDKQCRKALDDYSKAIELNAKDADAYCNRGAVYIMLGQYDKSIADLSKAIELNAKLRDAYHMRSEAYDKLGQHDLAERDSQREKEINLQ